MDEIPRPDKQWYGKKGGQVLRRGIECGEKKDGSEEQEDAVCGVMLPKLHQRSMR